MKKTNKTNKVRATFKPKPTDKLRPVIVVDMELDSTGDILVGIEETLKRMGLGSIFHPNNGYKVLVSTEVKVWPHGGWEG